MSATWRALPLLTIALIVRFLREGLVMRSLVWPAGLTVGTLLATLAVVASFSRSAFLAIPSDLDPTLASELEQLGWAVRRVEDPAERVRRGDAWAATDGHTLWSTASGPDLLRVEATIRRHVGATWRPDPVGALPEPADSAVSGMLICRLLSVLYALYGLVFGLGSVARDRDDGSLEAELALPIARWVPGLTRWMAASIVLTTFFGFTVSVFHGLMGVGDPWALVRHGFAATSTAAAIGLAMVGTAGTKTGFSGPLAAGLTAVTGLVGAGAAYPPIGRILPLASLLAGGSGWTPACLAVGLGAVSARVFALRAGRS